MKKVLIISFSYISIITLYSQWIQQPCPTPENLYDVSFVNRYTGWACGDYGQIIKTTNGGMNWFLQTTGVEGKLLMGIFAVDSNYVYSVGYFETIIKTTNGGTNWQVIRNGPVSQSLSFFRCFFLNRDTGWLMKNTYVLRTTNGCASFDSSYVNHSYMWDIQFKNYNTGLICGDGCVVLKTTNSGANWYQMPVPVGNELPAFRRISIVENTCWCIGQGSNAWQLGSKVFRSTNYGDTWDTIARVPDTVYGSTIRCNSFKSLNIGYCAGGVTQLGQYFRMFKTTNGGYNWYPQIVPNQYTKLSMWFLNDSLGWSVGGGGEILFTTSGGQWVDIKIIESNVPQEFELHQNYPNPFNPTTTIKYYVPKAGLIEFKVCDIQGKEIFYYSDYKQYGEYQYEFDGTNLSSGVYFYQLKIADNVISKKMILLK